MARFLGIQNLIMNTRIILCKQRNITPFVISKSSILQHHHQQYRHNSTSIKQMANSMSSTQPNIVRDKNRAEEFEFSNMTPTKLEKNEHNKVLQVIVEGNIGSGKTTFLNIFANSSSITKIEDRPFIVPEPIEAWRNVNGQNVFQLLAEDTKRWCFTFQSYVQLTMAKVCCNNLALQF